MNSSLIGGPMDGEMVFQNTRPEFALPDRILYHLKGRVAVYIRCMSNPLDYGFAGYDKQASESLSTVRLPHDPI